MSKQTRVFNPIYSFLPTEVEGFDSLAELALDMRWSWNHYADEVWRQLDPNCGRSLCRLDLVLMPSCSGRFSFLVKIPTMSSQSCKPKGSYFPKTMSCFFLPTGSFLADR